jgi:hypothetical protein
MYECAVSSNKKKTPVIKSLPPSTHYLSSPTELLAALFAVTPSASQYVSFMILYSQFHNVKSTLQRALKHT